jgi:hypothetical protein
MSAFPRLAGGLDPHGNAAPLLERKDHAAPSVFRPENMLREVRRQKELASGMVPPVCIIDPDGDMVAYLRRRYSATPSPHWACFHTRMWEWSFNDIRYGIVGQVVGGSFSVLVAEQLFASGCRLLGPVYIQRVQRTTATMSIIAAKQVSVFS